MPTGENTMKIEDVLKLIENYLHEAELKAGNPSLPPAERNEAMGAKTAYAHCAGLIRAVLEKKGWA